MLEIVIGAVIGGAIAILGGFLGELHSFRLQERREHRQRLAEVYELTQKCILNEHIFGELVPEAEQVAAFEDFAVKIQLYASPRVQDLYLDLDDFLTKHGAPNKLSEELQVELKEKIRALSKRMRKDLGVDKGRCRPLS